MRSDLRFNHAAGSTSATAATPRTHVIVVQQFVAFSRTRCIGATFQGRAVGPPKLFEASQSQGPVSGAARLGVFRVASGKWQANHSPPFFIEQGGMVHAYDGRIIESS